MVDVQISSVNCINIYCFGKVKIPNLFRNFPNIEVLNIYPYPDLAGNILPKIDPEIFNFLKGVNHNLLIE